MPSRTWRYYLDANIKVIILYQQLNYNDHIPRPHTWYYVILIIFKLNNKKINWLQNIYPRYANVQFNYALTTKRCEELLKINTQQTFSALSNKRLTTVFSNSELIIKFNLLLFKMFTIYSSFFFPEKNPRKDLNKFESEPNEVFGYLNINIWTIIYYANEKIIQDISKINEIDLIKFESTENSKNCASFDICDCRYKNTNHTFFHIKIHRMNDKISKFLILPSTFNVSFFILCNFSSIDDMDSKRSSIFIELFLTIHDIQQLQLDY
ncbi:hypothetical protein AGLY_006136 [Aphis glycines]|uniref:Uncharacterized protein n=1 Tax=Aphis glycines TaxID=307491 RepID=A0A6G0TT17_APHGL|nr:hypothetical protein AGLY_006136 [Aphis glycines]